MRTRKHKEEIVKEMREKFEKAVLVVLTDFHRMSVAESNKLRRKLRQAGAEYKVVKNTLMRHAYPGTPVEQVKDAFRGPTGVIFAFEDPVSTAKVVKEFLEDEEFHLEFKTAVVEGKPADIETIKQLATLPGREELLAQLAYYLNYPAEGLVRSLKGVLVKLTTVLENIKQEKEKSSA